MKDEDTTPRLIADGGTQIAAQVGDDGIARAEDMTGGVGFEAAVQHSQMRLAKHRDDESAHRKAAKNYAAFKTHKKFGGNSQLRKDEWKQIDDALVRVARDQLVMVRDLQQAGLTIPLDLGTLRWEWETMDDFGDADLDMAAESTSDEDAPNFEENGVPLPLAHKSWRYNLRKLRSSRNRGEPLDTASIAQATRSVVERLESLLANGVSMTVAGDQIYGYTNHPDREPVAGNATWDGATRDEIVDDVMRTVEGVEDNNFAPGNTGFLFYLAKNSYQAVRAKDSGTDSKSGLLQHLRERFASEEDLPEVRFRRADYLPDGSGVLVKPTEETVQLAVPSDIQPVEWESNGGMTLHGKVLGGMIPVLKSDQSGNMGLAHLSGI